MVLMISVAMSEYNLKEKNTISNALSVNLTFIYCIFDFISKIHKNYVYRDKS